MSRLAMARRWIVLATVGAGALGFTHEARSAGAISAEGSSELLSELKSYPHQVVYETNRDGNWELYLCNADGSNPVNLTRTSDVGELYPKPSPDGTKICFVADVGAGDAKVRDVYYMNSDGTGRTKIAGNGREPCWSPDGTRIAFMKGEFEKFNYFDCRHQRVIHLRPQDRPDTGTRQPQTAASLHLELFTRRPLVCGDGPRWHGYFPRHPGDRCRG